MVYSIIITLPLLTLFLFAYQLWSSLILPHLTEIPRFRSCSRDVITNNCIIYSSHKLVLKCFCDEQKPLTDQFITEMFAELEVIHLPLYFNNIWNLFAVKRIWKPIKIFYFFFLFTLFLFLAGFLISRVYSAITLAVFLVVS